MYILQFWQRYSSIPRLWLTVAGCQCWWTTDNPISLSLSPPPPFSLSFSLSPSLNQLRQEIEITLNSVTPTVGYYVDWILTCFNASCFHSFKGIEGSVRTLVTSTPCPSRCHIVKRFLITYAESTNQIKDDERHLEMVIQRRRVLKKGNQISPRHKVTQI